MSCGLIPLITGATPVERLQSLRETVDGRIVFSTSFGIEAQALTHMIAEAGLDIEFLSTWFSGLGIIGGDPTTAIKFQVANCLLDVAVVDRAVSHVLTSMAAFGLLDGAAVIDRPRPAIDAEAGADAAEDIALAGAVLLKNERDALPLDRRDLRSLAVIGPTAKAPLLGGGGSARVLPFPGVRSPLDVLTERAGASALLCVTPCYLKPSQAGMMMHFRTIHDATSLPIILYDVPARTGCALDDVTGGQHSSRPYGTYARNAHLWDVA